MKYLLKRKPSKLVKAYPRPYFTGFTGSGLRLRAYWTGDVSMALPMSYGDACRARDVWYPHDDIVEIVRVYA